MSLLYRQRGLTAQFQQRDALNERLLEDAQGDLAESQTMNERMRGVFLA